MVSEMRVWVLVWEGDGPWPALILYLQGRRLHAVKEVNMSSRNLQTGRNQCGL